VATLRCVIVPVDLKDRDAFHLTIEEYLQALISLIEELVRTSTHAYHIRLINYRQD
jgi:hypothetical protein